MSNSVQRVEADALELTVPDRARLVHRLIESLDEEAEDAGEVDAAWAAELERRVAEYATNPDSIPSSQVIKEARTRIQRG